MGEEQTMLTDEEVAQSTRISDIYAAAKRLEGIVRKTPLVYSEFFSEISGNATYLKLENLQTTGAFKLRGAYNRISMLTEEEKARASSPPQRAITHKGSPTLHRNSVSMPSSACPRRHQFSRLRRHAPSARQLFSTETDSTTPMRTVLSSKRKRATSTFIRSTTVM